MQATEAHGDERDDRLLEPTRLACVVVAAILMAAAVILWGFPGRTADLWAWTIKPDMTPIFIGSCYGAGCYFFARGLIEGRWHGLSAGTLATAVFAALIFLATLLHWERFNHGDAPTVGAVVFYAWVGVYLAAPFLVGALWLANRHTDRGRPEAGEPLVGDAPRRAARLLGAGTCLVAAVFFAWPAAAAEIWPWPLTPLTARVLASFMAQIGLAALLLSRDGRWGAWRLLLQALLLGTGLLLIGTVRTWSDLDLSNPLAWSYLAGLAGALLAGAGFHRSMQQRVAAAPTRR